MPAYLLLFDGLYSLTGSLIDHNGVYLEFRKRKLLFLQEKRVFRKDQLYKFNVLFPEGEIEIYIPRIFVRNDISLK
jgi:hypothetical protein